MPVVCGLFGVFVVGISSLEPAMGNSSKLGEANVIARRIYGGLPGLEYGAPRLLLYDNSDRSYKYVGRSQEMSWELMVAAVSKK